MQRALFSLAWSIPVAAMLIMAGCGSQVYQVFGDAMEPTFSDGQLITAVRTPPSQLERGDPVVYQLANGDTHMKRIIGLPGETVAIREGAVFIDSEPITAPYVLGQVEPLLSLFFAP